MARIAGSLEALLSGLIDYAGLYPPASLPLDAVLEHYNRYRTSRDAWILNRLALPFAALPQARPGDGWRVTLLVDDEPGALPPQVETLETRLEYGLSLPTYCEAPVERIDGAYAKIRTGGVTPDAIPSPEQVADFLTEAARRRMAFKATAGLHHSVRALHPLTYAHRSPRAVMHGFLNIFTAAAFAWHGMDCSELGELLGETDPRAFQFSGAEMRWRGHALTTGQVQAARRDFAHSFGCCSFEEPVGDLRELGFLP